MLKSLSIILMAASIWSAAPALAGGGSRGNAALLQTLPMPVRRAVADQIANGTLLSATRTNGDAGELLYDIDFTRAGKARNMTVALDGTLLDIQVLLDETPPAARAAILTLSQGGELGDITKNIGNDDFTYEVEVTRNGAARSYTLDDKGVLLEMQVLLPETPPAVQQTINAKVAGAILGDITKTMDGDEVSYTVAMTKAGRRRTFTVSASGELFEEQVFAAETPPAVQKAIQVQAGRGQIGKINLSTEDGVAYYEVTVNLGLNTRRVTFDAAGALVCEEQDMALASLPAKVKTALHPLLVAGEEVKDVTRTALGTNTTYDIELRKGQSRRTLILDPGGNILPP